MHKVIEEFHRLMRAIRWLIVFMFVTILGVVVLTGVLRNEQHGRQREHQAIITSLTHLNENGHKEILGFLDREEAEQQKRIEAALLSILREYGIPPTTIKKAS